MTEASAPPHPTWNAAWTADDPVDFGYSYSDIAEAEWLPARESFLERRDVGVESASGGSMALDHQRAAGLPYQMETDWQQHDCDLFHVFVLRGSVTFESADDQVVTLTQRGSAWIPRSLGFKCSYSPDYEGLEMRCPADTRMTRGRGSANFRAIYAEDNGDEYVLGDGPRSFLHYRDLGLREVSDDRIHLHIVECHRETPPEGTRWHYHSMCQWYFVLSGWGVSSVEGGRHKRRLVPGDAGTIGRGTNARHDWYMSSGYAVIEMCLPAEYDTITSDPPEGAHSDFTFLFENS